MDEADIKPQFPAFPVCQISFPDAPFLLAALEYIKLHTSASTVNHCLRCAAYSLHCMRKLPQFANVDQTLVVFACLFHDIGWTTNSSLVSKDKRFEVDGANIARAWIRDHCTDMKWSERQIQLCWDAIALHSTSSIAQHKELEVTATNMGIMADFLGPNMPGDFITLEEHKEIVNAFPRLGFHDEVIRVMCGLCKDKPETTFDNPVHEFGIKYGLDGNGKGKQEFATTVEENRVVNKLMGALKGCVDLSG